MKKQINKFINFLVKEEFISRGESAVCSLAISQITANTVNLLILILVGAIMGIVKEAIVFFFSFMALRIYAGGFHAKTERMCFIYSQIIILVSDFCIKYLAMYLTLTLTISSMSTVGIYIFAPVAAPAKPLSKEEYIFYGKIAKKMVIIQYLIAFCFYIFNEGAYGVAIMVAIMMTSILMILGIAK